VVRRLPKNESPKRLSTGSFIISMMGKETEDWEGNTMDSSEVKEQQNRLLSEVSGRAYIYHILQFFFSSFACAFIPPVTTSSTTGSTRTG
jgi:hypothetical protein